jgi:hypothetical protein
VINDNVEKILLLGLFYEPPKQVSPSSMPYAIVDFLNGKDFERKASQAFHLSTVDEDGWPREAMLSPGEMLALDASEVVIRARTPRGILRAMGD